MKSGELDKLIPILSMNQALVDAIQSMSSSTYKICEVALITNNSNQLVGVVNSSDIIRYLSSEFDTGILIKDIMNDNPIYAFETDTKEEIIIKVQEKVKKRSKGKKSITRFVPIVDKELHIIDVIDFYNLVGRFPKEKSRVKIYGLGFVGLTLAVTLSSRGHIVTGSDVNHKLISSLSKGQPHIYEPRLQDMLQKSLLDSRLKFEENSSDNNSEIHIICVGTPINDNGSVSLEAVESVTNSIAKNLNKDDIVMLRSTVPVGTTRNFILPILEKKSGLIAGKDFSLAFTPERTVEGNAIHEILSLPQIVGGLTSLCTKKTSSFWQTITNNVINLDSLEAAELVKLLNNSFRDLSFSFSNAFSLLAHEYNLDSNTIIQAANEGYPRNKIPRPSPGVGGYCLTKDPLLYSSTFKSLPHSKLSEVGRLANSEAAKYPLKVIYQYIKRKNLNIQNLNIVIAGLAFKGLPETNDLRGSTSLFVYKELEKTKANLFGFDAVIPNGVLKENGIRAIENYQSLNHIDILLILNNHPGNIQQGFLQSINQDLLLFDGWSLLDKLEVEVYEKITYASMGYVTKR